MHESDELAPILVKGDTILSTLPEIIVKLLFNSIFSLLKNSCFKDSFVLVVYE